MSFCKKFQRFWVCLSDPYLRTLLSFLTTQICQGSILWFIWNTISFSFSNYLFDFRIKGYSTVQYLKIRSSVFSGAQVGVAAVIAAPLLSHFAHLLLLTSRVSGAGPALAAYVFALLLTSGCAGVAAPSVVGQTLLSNVILYELVCTFSEIWLADILSTFANR